jgi:hypothetical protein
LLLDLFAGLRFKQSQVLDAVFDKWKVLEDVKVAKPLSQLLPFTIPPAINWAPLVFKHLLDLLFDVVALFFIQNHHGIELLGEI